MAKYLFEFSFNKKDLNKFEATCQASMRNLFAGTKKATIEGCKSILEESLNQVPSVTRTLANSAFYEVERRSDTAASTWQYEGTVGYGGNGDPVNPKTGAPASSYMMAVHEDLSADHPVGKAKFLEDPVREYMQKNFKRAVEKHARDSLKKFI